MKRSEACIDDANAVLPAPPPANLDTMALFLDVDGTLIDLAQRPDAVVVDPALPPLLRDLHVLLGGALAPLSGRPLSEVDALLGLGHAAAGVHGAEVRDARGAMVSTTAASPRMPALRERAQALLAKHPGVFIEAKPDALAVHYRNEVDAAPAVHVAAAILLCEAGSDYVLQPGNHVLELKRGDADKGRAVASLLRTPAFAGRTPWVVGDDFTDEHAFAVANANGGVSIIVGPRRPTAANHCLPDPHAVRRWLARLLVAGKPTRGTGA